MIARCVASAAVSLVLAAAATAGAGAQDIPRPTHYLPDIKVHQCFIIQPKMLSKRAGGTQINFTNTGTHNYHSVTFAVGYRNSDSSYIRKVVDHGQFAPGVTIEHRYDLYNDVTYGGKATTLCGAIAAT
ncbi:MAG TPA: hypothetical protein VMA36_05640 [Candidatus Limnocylindria bacterium]|jgi:hypothetical protein|nr:hypothetical protein [Candidatus Limnocylindria bacterium]